MAPRAAAAAAAVDAVFVESFDGGSHRAFREGWMRGSVHRWRCLTLPAERWKWRMRTAGMALGQRLAGLDPPPRVVVAGGLIDGAHLRAFGGLRHRARLLVYFHENQISYPRPPGEPLERGFAIAHLATVLAADGIAWNSRQHRDAMLAGVREILAEIPSGRPRGVIGRLRARSAVLPPGLDLDGFPDVAPRPAGDPPVIVWNHRWENDKRPQAFARIVCELDAQGVDFRLVLLGTTQQVRPRPLEEIRARLAPRILRAAPARTRAEYVRELARADVVVSTAAQENFGYSVLEAMAAGAVPLLPRRLSYPEIVPRRHHAAWLYDRPAELRARLACWLSNPGAIERQRVAAMRVARSHAWGRRRPALDAWVRDAAGSWS